MKNQRRIIALILSAVLTMQTLAPAVLAVEAGCVNEPQNIVEEESQQEPQAPPLETTDEEQKDTKKEAEKDADEQTEEPKAQEDAQAEPEPSEEKVEDAQAIPGEKEEQEGEPLAEEEPSEIIAQITLEIPKAMAGESLKSGDFEYKVNDDGNSVTITKYNGTATDVVIPAQIEGKTVTAITGHRSEHGEPFYVFGNNSNLTSIEIPASVETIGEITFYNCQKLTTVTFKDNSKLKTIGKESFKHCYKLESITIPGGVTTIGNNAFYGCSLLRSIEIPSSVEAIGESAFSNCSSLTSITIPSGVISINKYTFSNCSSLKSIEIPNGVTSIGNFTFSDCTSLKKVTIPDSVTSIGNQAFGIGYNSNNNNTSIETINFGGTKEEWKKLTAKSYNKDTKISPSTKIVCNDGEIKGKQFEFDSSKQAITKYYGAGGEVIIPETIDSVNVKTIGQYAFANCSSLTSVTIPRTVENFEYCAFSNCSNLTNVTFEANCQLKTIEDSSFGTCQKLESIIIPEGVTTIKGAFHDCIVLKTITLPKSLISIGDGIFGGDNSLETVYYNGTIEEWKALTSSANTKIRTEATIQCTDGTYSEDSGFKFEEATGTIVCYNGSIPKNLTIPSKINNKEVKAIKENAFSNKETIESVTFEEGVETIGMGAFHSCNNIKNLKLPNSLKTIDYSAFAYCTNLKTLTIPQGVTSIKNSAFLTCYRVEKILFLPTINITIDSGAFGECNGLKKIFFAGNESQWNAISNGKQVIGECIETIYNCQIATLTFKVVNGTFEDGSAEKTVDVIISNGKIVDGEIPTGMIAKEGYCNSSGSWDIDPQGTEIENGKTITYSFTEHTWNTPVYSWSEDGKSCTATRTCSKDNSHTGAAKATVTSEVEISATETVKGTTKYIATFSENWANTQTKSIQDIPVKEHVTPSNPNTPSSQDSDRKSSSNATSDGIIKDSVPTVTEQEATKVAEKAVQEATKKIENGETKIASNVIVNIENTKEIEPKAFELIAKEISKGLSTPNKKVTVNADTVANGKVMSRLYIDANEASKLATPIKATVNVSESFAKNLISTSIFESFFQNQVKAITFAQEGTFGMNMPVAVKLNFSEFKSKTVCIYAYDMEKNSYRLIGTSKNLLDNAGYFYFNTTVGETLILSDGILLDK